MTPKEKITAAYLDYVLEHGQEPATVFVLMKKIKLKESEFYQHFDSFSTLESMLWQSFLQETMQKLEQDETYQTYSVREKVLAFYFTFIETLKENRSYVIYLSQKYRSQMRQFPPSKPLIWKELSQSFRKIAEDWVAEGIESREIAERRLLTQRYSKALVAQLWLVIGFWVKDRSLNFEKTDSLIEKSVNTAFDLMAANSFDSVLDLGKFVLQNFGELRQKG
jgi:AcrR family transcriptional regulator